VTGAPAAAGKPRCGDKGSGRACTAWGTFDQPHDAPTRRKGTAQRTLTATFDLFSLGSARKGSAEPLRKEENRAVALFPRALCRTRTGDPFLTMAVRQRSRMPCAEPKCLHRPGEAASQMPAPIGTFRHPPVPREYLEFAGTDASLAVRRRLTACPPTRALEAPPTAHLPGASSAPLACPRRPLACRGPRIRRAVRWTSPSCSLAVMSS
jgi:hypothetical protein